MSSLDLSLLLSTGERSTLIGAGPAPLRLVLLPGEVLRMPHRGRQHLRVLAGTAWVTRSGIDMVISAGESAAVPASRDAAVISGLGSDPLLFEVL